MADTAVLDALGRLVDIMARLRGPGGCPWDREQTPESLRPYLLEETYEVLDALASGDETAVCEELGDLLLQVVFHAEIARQAGSYTIADVATGIADKLVRRHPHVFGDVVVRDAAEVMRNWQRQKAAERGDSAAHPLARLHAVSRTLPALARADEVGRKARPLGYDWPNAAGVRAKVDEELAELDRALAAGDRSDVHDEIGDLLLAIASLARHHDLSPELALRDATERFLARVQRCADLAQAEGLAVDTLDEETRDRLWTQAKTTPKRTGT